MRPLRIDEGSLLDDAEEEAWRDERIRRGLQDSIIGSIRLMLEQPPVSQSDAPTEQELKLLRTHRTAEAEFFRQLADWGNELMPCEEVPGRLLPRRAIMGREFRREDDRRIRQYVNDYHRWAVTFRRAHALSGAGLGPGPRTSGTPRLNGLRANG